MTLISWMNWQHLDIFTDMYGELIYTCKMIQPGIFSRFKPDNLLLSTARFPGYNLEKYTG
jgi:hypothetical protein